MPAYGMIRQFGPVPEYGKQNKYKTMAKRIIIDPVELGDSGALSREKINSNFDKLDTALDKGLDAVADELDKEVNRIEGKIDTISEGIDTISAKVANMSNLGIRKTYYSSDQMYNDVNNPIGDDGLPILNGQLVFTVSSLAPREDAIFSYIIKGSSKKWEFRGYFAIPGDMARTGGSSKTIQDLDNKTAQVGTRNYLRKPSTWKDSNGNPVNLASGGMKLCGDYGVELVSDPTSMVYIYPEAYDSAKSVFSFYRISDHNIYIEFVGATETERSNIPVGPQNGITHIVLDFVVKCFHIEFTAIGDKIEWFQLEKGSIPSDFHPAWEDTLEKVTGGSAKTIEQLDATKVDKVSGKGLSTNDYTTDDKTKLGALPTNTQLTASLAAKADISQSDTSKVVYAKETTSKNGDILQHNGTNWANSPDYKIVDNSGDLRYIPIIVDELGQIHMAYDRLLNKTILF